MFHVNVYIFKVNVFNVSSHAVNVLNILCSMVKCYFILGEYPIKKKFFSKSLHSISIFQLTIYRLIKLIFSLEKVEVS